MTNSISNHTLKTWKIPQGILELTYNSQKGLKGYIHQKDRITEIATHSIRGIPQEVKRSIKYLKHYLPDTYAHVKTLDDIHFAVYISPRLKGEC